MSVVAVRPFGHRAKVRVRRTERVGAGALAEQRFFWVEVDVHCRGSAAAVLRSARRVRGFEAVLEVEPLSKREYLAMYGNGSETGRYRIV
jgi:hypothetical protein